MVLYRIDIINTQFIKSRGIGGSPARLIADPVERVQSCIPTISPQAANIKDNCLLLLVLSFTITIYIIALVP